MQKTPDGRTRVTLIKGDGIGPEVTNSAQKIIDATGVKIAWEECEAGAAVFKKGLPSGVPPETIKSIGETRLALKGPLETPIGFGEKSANVTLRKLFECFANIRPVKSVPAGVKTFFSSVPIDLVIVRENVEDLYAGIEHMETPGVAQCLKIMSKKGCEKIVRTAFEYAKSEGRTKVHCATKANIMKLTEGLMKKTFEEVAKEYPEIDAQHIIIDNCTHQLVRFPEDFQVIVTSNMNGDIISDLSSGLIGGLGFAPGANLGNDVAIFEAVHGSAPKYAGKNVINPTAVILSGVMMLRYMGELDAAEKIENAIYRTLEDGAYTRDVKPEGSLSTTDFTARIIANFGKKPSKMEVRKHTLLKLPQLSRDPAFVKVKTRRVVGVDIFFESSLPAEQLGKSLEQLSEGTSLKLKLVESRGTKLYPSTGAMPDTVDAMRGRFMLRDGGDLADGPLIEFISKVGSKHRWAHIEKLQEFDGVMGFTKAQGED